MIVLSMTAFHAAKLSKKFFSVFLIFCSLCAMAVIVASSWEYLIYENIGLNYIYVGYSSFRIDNLFVTTTQLKA